MAAGQIGISVFPNLEGFQSQIRDAVRKESKNKVEVKVDVERDQLDNLEKSLDGLKDYKVNVKVDVDESNLAGLESLVSEELKAPVTLDTAPAMRTFELLQRSLENETITTKMTLQVDESEVRDAARRASSTPVEMDGTFVLDTTQARKSLEELEDDYKVIQSYLTVDTSRADTDMHDFRQGHLAENLVQRVVLDYTGGGSGPQMPQQQQPMIMPSPNPKSYTKIAERDTFNIINMWGKTWEIMNDQIDVGINDIYDKYRKAIVGAAKFAGQPFTNFTGALDESKTFNEFFDNLKFRFAGAHTLVGKFGRTIGDLKGPVSEAGGHMRDMFAEIQGGFGKMEAPPIFATLGNKLKNASATVKGWGSSFSGALRNVGSKASGAVKNIGPSLSGAFSAVSEEVSGMALAGYRRLQGVVSEGLQFIKPQTDELGRIFGPAADGLKKFFPTAIKIVGDGLGNMGDSIANGVAKAKGKATNGIKSLSTSISSGMKSVSSAFSTGMKSVGSLAGDVAWSADIFDFGPKISDGFRRAQPTIDKAMTGISESARKTGDSITGAFQKVPASVGNAFSKLGGNVNKVFSKVSGQAQKAGQSIGGHFSRNFSRIGNNARTLGSGIGNSFKTMGRSMSGPLGASMSKITKTFSSGMGIVNKSIGNSTASFTVFRGALRVMGGYASGFMRIAGGAFTKVSGIIMGAMVPAIMAAVAGLVLMGGQAIIGGILALAGALMSVVGGALLMAPALIGVAGISFGALKIGLEGVSDAVGAAFNTETVEEFEEAMAGVPASVQSVARAFRTFKPAIDEMKTAVQDNLLADLAPGIDAAMSNLLPSISAGMQDAATFWNESFQSVLDELGSDRAGAGMETLMQGLSEMAESMVPALGNVVAMFGSLAEQGAKFLGPLGESINGLTEGWLNWAEGLREPLPGDSISEFDRRIQRASTNAGHLSGILGGLAGTIGNVLGAAVNSAGGQEMLAGMASSMRDLRDATEEGTEGYAKIVEFMATANDAASQLGVVLSPVLGIIGSVATALLNIANGVIPGIGLGLEALLKGFEPIEAISFQFGENLGNALGAIAPALEGLGGIVAPLLLGISEGFGALFTTIGPSLAMLVEAFKPAAVAISGLFETVGLALGDIFVAAAPLIASGAQILETLAPILGQIFEWIGKIGSRLLEVIGPLLTEHDEAITKLLESIQPLIDVIGNNLMLLLDMLAPYIPMISAVMGILINAVATLIPLLTPIIDFVMKTLVHLINFLLPIAGIIGGIMLAVKLWGLAVSAFNIIMGILRGVMMAARFATLLFNLALKANPIGLVITAVVALVGALIYFFTQTETGRKIWDRFTTFLGDAWTGFSNVMGNIWNWIVEYVWNPLVNWVNSIRETWSNFTTGLGNKWEEFRHMMGVGWDWIVRNIFDRVQGIVDGFRDRFQTMVDQVKGIWNQLRETFATPIEFFLEHVINNGVIKGWNSVMGLINKEEEWGLTPIDVPNALRFKDGGTLPGFTPGRDVHDFRSPTGGRLMLSGGESIMRPEWTQAVGGPRAVDNMNLAARNGRFAQTERHNHNHAAMSQGGTLAFAGGGVIPAMMSVVQQKYPQLQMTSGARPGQGGMHGAGLATDWSNGSGNTPAQLSLANDIATTYPGSAELIYDSPGWTGNLNDGQNVGAFGGFYNMAQAGPHHHHVHWGMTTPPTMPFGGGVFEGGSNGGGGGPSGMSLIMGILNPILNPIKDKLSSFVEPFGHYGKLALGFGQEAISKGIQGIKDHVMNILPGFLTGGGGGGTQPAESYRAGVIAAFERQGENPLTGRVDALLRQISSESSGDPNVAQNIYDANGTGESAGVGLYQFIPSTWAGFRDPGLPNDRRNVEASHNAAVRYFRDRHGWNTGPGGVGNGHGWKDGGVFDPELTKDDLFDQGGMANGIGVMGKDVIVPERVLSPIQTEAFNDFVYGFMPQLINSYRTRPFELRQAVSELIDGWNAGQERATARIGAKVDHNAEVFTRVFEATSKGARTDTEYEIDDLIRRFPGYNINTITLDQVMADGNFLQDWWGRNQASLKKNLDQTIEWTVATMRDPDSYLEAEGRAREALDAKEEEEAKAAKEKADEAKREQDEKERAARDEERNGILEGLSEDQKELKQAEFDRQDKERTDQEKIETDRIREEERAEKERVDALKATGEYYYGYKVLNEDATNPIEYEDSAQVAEAKRYTEKGAEFLGVGDAYDGVMSRLTVLQSLDSAVQLAIPAWKAALGGNFTGLMYNVAAAQAANTERVMTDAQEMGPSALFGALEMVASGTSQTAPFVGTVNSGMTPGQLNSTLTHYEAQRARRVGGTTRVR